MALAIRLTRTGKRGERKFRIIVKEKRDRRDGKVVENLGWYIKTDTTKNQKNINKERYNYWISVGAIPSATVKKIVEK